MRLWRGKSIAGKLTRLNLLVSGIALLMAYVSFLAYDLLSLRQNLINSLNAEAAIVSANSVTALMFDDPQTAEATLASLRGSPHVRAGVILGEDGRVFAQFTHDGSPAPEIDDRLTPSEESQYWGNGPNVLFGHRIRFEGRSLGAVYLLAETSDVAHRAERFGLMSACILMLCFIAALLATATIRRLITEPLTDLAETALVVSRNRDYSVRARLPKTSDELAFLVQSFNEMLEQIQQRDRALKESRNALEQRVQERTAELMNANKELEAFSYSVAHDLRGPLQHISNIGYLMEQTWKSGNTQDAPMLIEKLFEGSNRMSKLIDDLLNLSKATSTPLRQTPINLSNMAKAILQTLASEDPQRKVEVAVQDGALVIADEGLLQQVLDNLLRNAWKYTSHQHEARIEFGSRREGRETVFYVRDNGVGFNPQYADRLFRPFQRLHSQNEFPGTGVGLATVLRIIARHGGTIGAKGEVDQGAEFFFTLPYEPAR